MERCLACEAEEGRHPWCRLSVADRDGKQSFADIFRNITSPSASEGRPPNFPPSRKQERSTVPTESVSSGGCRKAALHGSPVPCTYPTPVYYSLHGSRYPTQEKTFS
jgi:hypothetical protein